MSTAKLRLSNHGSFLVKELENCTLPKDLRIMCLDGDFMLHKIVFCAVASTTLLKAIKQNKEDDVIQILVPDAPRSQVEKLVQLLYTGQASCRSEEELNDLKSLSNFLKVSSLSISLHQNVGEVENQPGELQVEVIERKKIAKPPAVTAPDDVGVRRSNRPKFKAKRLQDFETKVPFLKGDEHPKEEKSPSESRVTEKTISNLVVKVMEPEEDALELRKQSLMPSDIIKMCLVCEKKLLGKYALSKHLKSKHGQGNFKCRYCGEILTSGHALHEHARQKKHENGQKVYKKTSYQCDINNCVEAFHTFNAFQAHCLKVHQMFPLECKICKKRYKEQATFRNHAETHLNQLKYECDICSKKFVTRERLFAHRRLHLGKRFHCTQSQCDFKARSSGALRNHIKMKHLDRQFQCTTCDKKFASKQNLEQHVVIHTGATSWHCCDQSFKRLHHYKSHLNSLSHKTRLKENQKSKATVAKAEEIGSHQAASSDFSLVIPQFNDEDLINLADNNFMDDSNVQFIIVNEANQDVMLISDEVKLSDAATEETSLMM